MIHNPGDPNIKKKDMVSALWKPRVKLESQILYLNPWHRQPVLEDIAEMLRKCRRRLGEKGTEDPILF